MNRLAAIIGVILSVSSAYAANESLKELNRALKQEKKAVLVSSEPVCYQTVEVINGESYPHEVCK